MKKVLWISALIIAAVMLAQNSVPVVADDTVKISEDDVNEIAELLYCPVCENVPLDVCPTQACIDWRMVIREMLSEGKTKEEIIAHFSTQYGWSVLPMPPRVGLNWLIYILPPAIILVGGGLIVRLMQKGKKLTNQKTVEVTSHNAEDLEDYLDIINRDLEDNEKNG